MHIALIGPVATNDIADLLPSGQRVPPGYSGAPFMGHLIRGYLNRGLKVTAVTTDSTLPLRSAPWRAEAGNLQLVVCPSRPHAWRLNGYLLGRALDFFRYEVKVLSQVLAGIEADVLHAHWSYEFALAALEVNRNALVTCHDAPIQVLRYTRSPYRFMRWQLARKVFKRGKNFTAVSSYMVDQLRESHGIKAALVPNPIAERLMAIGSTRLHDSRRRVVMVNNGWNPLKNVAAGVAGFLKWSEKEPSAELHLFGLGYGPGEIAEQTLGQVGMQSPKIHFRGAMSHEGLMHAMADMDLLLHAALEESFGVVVAEAMALGLPVLGGHRSGAVPWVIGTDTLTPAGLVVDVSSTDEIAAGLARMFGNSYPEYSANGRKRVYDNFLLESVVDQYLEVLARAGKGSSRC